jgi:hypothetical protein
LGLYVCAVFRAPPASSSVAGPAGRLTTRSLLLLWDERFALLTVECFCTPAFQKVSVMVGGNIDGFTPVMTCAIALETSQGDRRWPSWASAAGRGAAAER